MIKLREPLVVQYPASVPLLTRPTYPFLSDGILQSIQLDRI